MNAKQEAPEILASAEIHRICAISGLGQIFPAHARTSIQSGEKTREITLGVHCNRLFFRFEDDLRDDQYPEIFALISLRDPHRIENPVSLVEFGAREWKAGRIARVLLHRRLPAERVKTLLAPGTSHENLAPFRA